MGEKVLFITNFSKEKKKARLLYEIELLKSENYEVDTFYFEGRYSIHGLLLSYLSLKFFNFHQVLAARSLAKRYDHVVIYGLQPLPVVLFIRNKVNIVYQSLDDNVSYTIYELGKRFKPFKWISRPLDWVMRKVELMLSKNADHILVNSIALNEYLVGSKLNYYTSPFENTLPKWSKPNEFALLYLGQLREEKGTQYIVETCQKFKVTCHFFGIPVDDISRKFTSYDFVRFYGNKTAEELQLEIVKLSERFNLVGVSMIKSIHRSYETQEANKDIDYMAMGIPFIGNDRVTTKSKIDAGCGVHFSEAEKIFDFEHYLKCSEKSVEVYMSNYSSEKFNQIFLSCFV